MTNSRGLLLFIFFIDPTVNIMFTDKKELAALVCSALFPWNLEETIYNKCL